MIFPGQIIFLVAPSVAVLPGHHATPHPRRVMHSVTGFPFTSGLMVQTGRKSQ